MKLTAILLLAACLQVSARVLSQNVTLKAGKTSLEKVLEEITQQTGYEFLYRNTQLKQAAPVTIHVRNLALKDALDLIFKGQPLNYEIANKTIVISPKTLSKAGEEPEAIVPPPVDIRGRVTDADGKPVVGASVVVKGAKAGIVTDKEGYFRMQAKDNNTVLVISFVGYTSKEIKVKAGELAQVQLVATASVLDDVEISVSTGMFARKRETFTGATATFSGAQLLSIGNQNIIQSLKTLDPSFIITENNIAGANPNVMPTIEIRGQSSLTTNTLRDQFNSDPNQPLFVLDGFVTTLKKIVDLDMNRVASITILKDAASAALYGAKAANGVVVVETKRPKPGKLRLTYTGDFNVQAPNLNVYNMMTAPEELQFEKLAGRYTMGPNQASWPIQYYLDELYNKHLQAVKQGVNTYWLSEPVQVGYAAGTSVFAEGGDNNSVRYGIGFNYRNNNSVMKGNDRNTYSGTIEFSYRTGKFNFSNRFYLNGYSKNESPYGSFSDFVNAPTYYPKRNASGTADKYLEISRDYNNAELRVSNPLYNASLPFIDNEKSLGFSNNLQAIYSVSPSLQVQGGLSINQTTSTNINFLSPDNTAFQDSSIFTKGRYTNQRVNIFDYQANLGLMFGKVFNNVHQLTANLRGELEQNNNDAISFVAVGFPAGSNGNPSFSYSYQNNARPSSAISVYRRNNLVFSSNYVFDRRFFGDFTYRVDGSTAFGSNRKYTGFWAVGAGWNLHQEPMFRNQHWISTLRLRANKGTTGNQGFGSLTSVATYTYDSYINLFGQGLNLTTLGNPDLKWQVTEYTNLGMDGSFFKGRFSFGLNVFQKLSDPMVVVVPLPSSTGLNNYPMNAGRLYTKGIDLNTRVLLINNLPKRMVWSVGATLGMLKSEYQRFNNTLASLNKLNQASNSLYRYSDGYSPSDIWAVPSMGIDPATGMELFLKKNGQSTYIYDPADIVKVGNTQPAAQGVISTNFSYKGFYFNASLRYSIKGYIFNSALYNKVENITYRSIGNNQDRRALYDRWQKPGDNSQFKGLYLVASSNPFSAYASTSMSSRFVQREDFLSGESFSLGYDFTSAAWIRHLGMSTLRVTAYANEIFRLSTVQRERGTDFPFANVYSLSISASF